MISYMPYPGPLGTMLLAATHEGLCGVYFAQHKYFDGPQDWRMDERHPLLRQTASELDGYFSGDRHAFDVPLDLKGTPFQVAVWTALRRLSFGVTSSYREIAAVTGRPAAVRAAGTAIGRNPVSIIVPCHRVLGSSGALSGYAGGLDRKRFLLSHEAATHGSISGAQ